MEGAARCHHLIRRLGHRRTADTNNVRPRSSETYGDRLSDTGIGPGDDGAAAGKIERVHRRLSIGTLSMSVKLMLSPAIAQMKE